MGSVRGRLQSSRLMDGSDASLIGEEGRGPRESLLIGYLSSFFSDYDFGNDFVQTFCTYKSQKLINVKYINYLFLKKGLSEDVLKFILHYVIHSLNNKCVLPCGEDKKFAIIFNSPNMGLVFSASHHM